jgi:glycosyltransferase involved in cell wall biosynthesis
MALVSILTAAQNPRSEWINEAYSSLKRQGDLDWEWVIQLDGPREYLDNAIETDPRVFIQANHEKMGTALTRNRALLRCSSDYIQNLDSDDYLLDNVLTRSLEILSSPSRKELANKRNGLAFFKKVPELAFCVSNVVAFEDSYEQDSQGMIFKAEVPEGFIRQGDLCRWFIAHPGHEGVCMSNILYRKSAIWEVGAWHGLYFMQDSAMLMAINHRHPGFYRPQVTATYRLHPGQKCAHTHISQETKISHDFIGCYLQALGYR